MTKRDLIDEIVKLYPTYSRRDAEVIVNAVFDSMTEALCSGERIEIRGFGSFVVKDRRAREGRNPKTGEIVAVAAKRVPFFKVGKELKQRVDNEPHHHMMHEHAEAAAITRDASSA
ncbi:MAG: integration host factor subunit beta [Myxococcales bacterium]|jgi:integration host factor beta subunit|nr:MAG: integration host factor subunit beta [Myxococcales bacterium]